MSLSVGAAGLLAVATTSPINIGVRHVMVLYPLIALPAAFGWARMAEAASNGLRARVAPGALLAAQAVLLVAAVPYQSSFYNVLAGDEPAYVSSDSDFDWGQDGLALQEYFRAHTVPELQVQIQGTLNLCRFDLPPVKALTTTPKPGWIAVSERLYRLNGVGRADPCATVATPLNPPSGWLDWLKPLTPHAIIGNSIRLYHVTEGDLPRRIQRRPTRTDLPAFGQ